MKKITTTTKAFIPPGSSNEAN